MAVSLCEQGFYQWDEFRDHLIAEIAAGEQAAGPNPYPEELPSYYQSWLAALEKLLNHVEDGLNKLSDQVSRKYLIHAGAPRQMQDDPPLSLS